MDWWFAASPAVAATWIRIHERWPEYLAALRARGIGQGWAHWTWPAHIHIFLNMSAAVRFHHVRRTATSTLASCVAH